MLLKIHIFLFSVCFLTFVGCDSKSTHYDITRESLVFDVRVSRVKGGENDFFVEYALYNIGRRNLEVCNPKNTIYIHFVERNKINFKNVRESLKTPNFETLILPAGGKLEGKINYSNYNGRYDNPNGSDFYVNSGEYEIFFSYIYNKRADIINSHLMSLAYR